jgi:hypothetical protein
MAAGLGFKDFTTGEVLTAADVDGYLMQGIWVFASATARDAAVTSPQEGNFAYLKDTNTTTYYTGSAWTNLDTTGMVNPMTTTGDIIYSSSGSTPARLGIGSTGNVLTVSGGLPVWSAPAGGGKIAQVVSATQSTVAAINSGTYTDINLTASITPTSATSTVLVFFSVPTNSLAGRYGKLQLVRGSTAIHILAGSGSDAYPYSDTAQVILAGGSHYLDSPATTSSTTYKLQAATSAQISYNYAPSVITLMEVLA